MKYFFICGVPGSGKGLLRTLLDGHTDISTCPFQGYGYNFFDPSFEKFLKRKRPYATLSRMSKMEESTVTVGNSQTTIGELFRQFSRSYGEIVDASLSKKIRAASSAEGEVFVDFDFDLNHFNDKVFELLQDKKNHNLEDVYGVFSSALISCWSNMNNDGGVEGIKYFSQSAHNGIDVIENITNASPGSKIIIVDRSSTDLVYTNTKRLLIKNYGMNGYNEILKDRDSFIFLNKFTMILLSRGFLSKIREYKSYISSINSKNVHVVNFERLVLDTSCEMRGVANFLGVEYEDVLSHATLNSVHLAHENNRFVGKINDNSANYVSSLKSSIIKFATKS